jgi:hypothetical protein
MKTLFNLNQDCENALIDFPFHDIATTWIDEQKFLFQIIENIRKSDSYKNSHIIEIVFIDIFFETYSKNK